MFKVLLSPSKSQQYDRDLIKFPVREPVSLVKSLKLLERLRQFDVQGLAKLMQISEKLSVLNTERFAEMQSSMTLENSKPCLQAFTGDVYSGFDLNEYSRADYEYADKVLCILSGFYGLLRPLDFIQPYRLEMKTKLDLDWCGIKNLYEFWGDDLTNLLNKRAGMVVNLASKEYSSVIDFSSLNNGYVDIDFYELKDGKPKIVAIHAKKARGIMADWIVRDRIETLEDLRKFNLAGYKFDKLNSSDLHFKFVRS